MRITIDQADRVFSQAVRLKQGKCQRCGSLVRVNLKTRLPVSHTLSHFFGRGKESTRFDLENCDVLCFPCHRLWGGDEREEYLKFKIKQLGKKGFDLLHARSTFTTKKDRKMALIQSKLLLKEILG